MNAQNEAFRFEQLRAQDGQPVVPPPNLAALCKGGGLDPAQVGAAEGIWNTALAEMTRAPAFPSEERLFWTSFLLANHEGMQQQRDLAAARLQRVLPVLQQTRHQQIVTGMLARHLAALGRTDEATHYLGSLQAYSDDLQVDTNYRFSTAFVALLRGDSQTVLSVLGTNLGDVPISDAYDLVCGVYRAHALETLGNLELAQQQLQKLAPTPDHLGSLESVVRATTQVALIPRSLQATKIAVTQLHQGAITTNSGLNVKRIMLVAFLGAPLAAAAAGAAGALLPAPVSGYVMAGVIGGLTIAVLATVFGGFAAAAASRKRLIATGLDGVAQLMSVEQTGTRINDQPMLRLRMLIDVAGRPTYAVLHKEVVPQIRLAMVQPGTQLRVKVDPANPRGMAIIWG